MDRIAVFGIGSSNFRFAVGRVDGTLPTEITVERTRPRELSGQILDALETLRETAGPVDAVAVTAPGLVDPESGCIREFDTPAGETIERIDVAASVRDVDDWPVIVENDCSASALAEWRYGAGAGHDCIVHVTFGTGIGGGVVERGRLLRGNDGQAGEFGLLPVASESDCSSLGVDGAWEAVCSGRGIPEYVRHRLTEADHESSLSAIPSLTAQDVFEAAVDGDTFAQTCLSRIDRYNAAGIGAVCNAVNPGCVTLGGGVALNNPERILSGVEDHVDDFLFVDRPDLHLSPLGEDIGLYGALAAAVESRVVERPSADRGSAEATTD